MTRTQTLAFVFSMACGSQTTPTSVAPPEPASPQREAMILLPATGCERYIVDADLRPKGSKNVEGPNVVIACFDAVDTRQTFSVQDGTEVLHIEHAKYAPQHPPPLASRP